MGVGTNNVTKTLDRIGTIAATVTGIVAADVHQGYKRFFNEDEFYQEVLDLTAESKGVFSYWLRSHGESVKAEDAVFEVEGELLVNIDKDASTDANTAIELAIALKDALLVEGSYAAGEAIPDRIAFEIAINVTQLGGIMAFNFGKDGSGTMTFRGGC